MRFRRRRPTREERIGSGYPDHSAPPRHEDIWPGGPMSPEVKLIHDWLGSLIPEDLGLTRITPGVLAALQSDIAAGRYKVTKTCAHCSKPITGKVHRWSTRKLPVHEACRTELFEKRATLGEPSSRDDRIDHAAIRQNLEGAYDGKLVREGDRFVPESKP